MTLASCAFYMAWQPAYIALLLFSTVLAANIGAGTTVGAAGMAMLVTAIAVTSVSPDELAASPAPLSLVFQKIVGISPAAYRDRFRLAA